MIETDKIYNSDCMELMRDIADNSIDAVICDLPYGTTPCDWDKILPMDELWNEYKRIIKSNGSLVLFGVQPFTTKLISSNMDMWKYNWIWVKENSTNFLNSHYQPLKTTEDICVFGYGSCAPSSSVHLTYNPQIIPNAGVKYRARNGNRTTTSVVRGISNSKYRQPDNNDSRYPTNIIYFPRDNDERIHPTQKPVDLLRYLVRTHTNEGDVVLDNCMGVGSTIIACIKENRHYIGIEKDEKWYSIARRRIDLERRTLTLF